MFRNVFAFSLIVALACSVFLMARPPQEHILNTPLLDEASGLARGLKNPHLLYSHNDSGGKNSVYAIDSKGNLIAEIHLPTVKNRDWEEMATCIDPISKKPMIYVGDIGDNKAKYKNYRIHIFEEPLIEDSLVVMQDVRTIKLLNTSMMTARAMRKPSLCIPPPAISTSSAKERSKWAYTTCLIRKKAAKLSPPRSWE